MGDSVSFDFVFYPFLSGNTHFNNEKKWIKLNRSKIKYKLSVKKPEKAYQEFEKFSGRRRNTTCKFWITDDQFFNFNICQGNFKKTIFAMRLT